MKIEIKLENPKYCDECPCLNIDCGGYYDCHICQYMELEIMADENGQYIRPKKCVDENGK
jgi:hypothetical protein